MSVEYLLSFLGLAFNLGENQFGQFDSRLQFQHDFSLGPNHCIGRRFEPDSSIKCSLFRVGPVCVLTKSGSGSTVQITQLNYQFNFKAIRYFGETLRGLLKSRATVVGDDAAVVNAISDLGWDLISHSQAAAATNPEINSGSTVGKSEVFVNETWWFKRR